MYALPDMIDLANQKWRSSAHKKVAVSLLIGNPRIVTRQQLIELGAAINALTLKAVKTLTIEGAVRMGIPFN